VRLVLANKALTLLGGSEAYLITVAEQLQRLGHDVIAYAPELGEAAQGARDRGIRVVSGRELPEQCDGVLAQDAITAYELAELYPEAVRVYVAHSHFWLQHRPPQLRDVSQAVVVLNDYVRRYLEAHAFFPEVVRLRQPVDVTRFGLGVRRAEPRRVLAFGNDWIGAPHRIVSDACRAAGLRLDHVGLHGRTTTTPELDIAEADIVVGVGRCILEAMASGRAAYVFGITGGDGWVTPDSYPALEASGFTGTATETLVTADLLLRDLEQFDPKMGESNRDLVFAHHRAEAHAADLVGLFRRLESRPASGNAPLAELSRLTRVGWEAEMRARQLAWKAHQKMVERDRMEQAQDRWQAEYERAASSVRELHDAYNRLLATRRWRFAQAIGKPLDMVRRLRRRFRYPRASPRG
jgi:hypothetical protein